MQCLTLEECSQWRKEHCRRDTWKRQVSCHTPLKRLPWYTTTLVEQLQPFDHALLIIDAVVFDVPPALLKLRHAAGERRPVHEAPGHAFVDDHAGFRSVLEAAMSGWFDMRALFSPSSLALSADHDEYTTFFSLSSGKRDEVGRVLSKGGVKLVEYTAKSPYPDSSLVGWPGQRLGDAPVRMSKMCSSSCCSGDSRTQPQPPDIDGRTN